MKPKEKPLCCHTGAVRKTGTLINFNIAKTGFPVKAYPEPLSFTPRAVGAKETLSKGSVILERVSCSLRASGALSVGACERLQGNRCVGSLNAPEASYEHV